MTPQQPPPYAVQVQMARAELKALQGHQTIAEQGILALSNVAAELSQVDRVKEFAATNAILAALVALVSIRLFEFQNAHQANAERIAQLEGFLTKADSRIAIPNLQV